MRLTKKYHHTRFEPEEVNTAYEMVSSLEKAAGRKEGSGTTVLSIHKNADETWGHDSIDEWMADYRERPRWSKLYHHNGPYVLDVAYSEERTEISIGASSRIEILRIFTVFDSVASKRLQPVTEAVNATVFIGHGRNQQWRDLKDHMQDQHGYQVEAYEVGARAGHTIRDILEDMMTKSSCALLVLTGEDETVDGGLNPRLNVVHELGLFQGKLGFARAVVLLEDGVSEFSNIHGIHQIRFNKGRIRESFGDVLAFLRREVGR